MKEVPITFTAIVKDEQESKWIWDNFKKHTLKEPISSFGLQIINIGEGDCVKELSELRKKYDELLDKHYKLEEKLENTIRNLELAIEDIS